MDLFRQVCTNGFYTHFPRQVQYLRLHLFAIPRVLDRSVQWDTLGTATLFAHFALRLFSKLWNTDTATGYTIVGFIWTTNTNMQLFTRTVLNCAKITCFSRIYMLPFRTKWEGTWIWLIVVKLMIWCLFPFQEQLCLVSPRHSAICIFVT